MWSHYVELLKLGDINIINYYINTIIKQNLSVRELRNKIKKYKNLKPAQYASIVIIDGNIPCLVFHRDNPGLDSNKDPIIPRSISSIHIPFQGENINQIVFKIYETREILDILADDDYQPKYKSPYANCAKMI